jgi:hypothetical protein
MTAKYKVLGKVKPKRKPIELLALYDVPVDALDLQEALTLLETAEQALKRVDPLHIVRWDDREFGHAMLSSQLALIYSWKRTVLRKLQGYIAK